MDETIYQRALKIVALLAVKQEYKALLYYIDLHYWEGEQDAVEAVRK